MKTNARILFLYMAVAFLPGDALAQAQETGGPSVLTLEAFVGQVLERNPRLAGSQAGLQASRERVPQAGALPDPMVAIALMNLPWDTFRFSQEPMTMKQLTLTQSFPAPGVLGARTRLAESGVEVADSALENTRDQLVAQARGAWLDLYFLDRSLDVVEENLALLQQFIQVAESRYRTGRGIQQDVLKADLELSRLTERQIGLEQARQGVLSRMNALRDTTASLPVRTAPLPDVTIDQDAASLTRAAIQENASLRQARAMVGRQQAAVELARRLRLPGWNASAAYGQRDGGRADLLTAMVSIQIPIWASRKQDRAIQEEEAALRSAEFHERDLELGVRSDVERLWSDLERARRLSDLYDEQIVPQAEGVLSSALAGYRVDEVDFLSLLHAQTTLLNYELEAVRTRTDYQRRLADLEAAVGRPLMDPTTAQDMTRIGGK